MNFDLIEDQVLLEETVGRFFEREYDYRRELAGGGSGLTWTGLAELGLLGALLPEADGGFGGSVEAMLVAQAAGQNLVLEPLIEQVIVAGTLLGRAGGDEAAKSLADAIDGSRRIAPAILEPAMRSPFDHAGTATRVTRDGAGLRLSGRKAPAIGGDTATHFLVTARDDAGELRLLLVPAPGDGCLVRRMVTIDGRGAAEIDFAMTLPAEAMLDVPDAAAALDAALDAGLAAACGDMVGAMSAMLERTREYTLQREQYGAKLASYQALQHRMADMFIALELARSMAFLAASASYREPGERAGAVSAAWHEVLRSARIVAEGGVQLHGGMGMSEETDVAHYFKRLTTAASCWGSASTHLRRFDHAPRLERPLQGEMA